MIPTCGVQTRRGSLALMPVSENEFLLLAEQKSIIRDNRLQPPFLYPIERAQTKRLEEFIPPIWVTIVHEELHWFLYGGVRNVPSDVKITFFINFHIGRIPTVIYEDRIVFGVLTVKVDFLIIMQYLNQIVLAVMRQTVSLSSGDRIDVGGIPTHPPLLKRARDISPQTMRGRLPDNDTRGGYRRGGGDKQRLRIRYLTGKAGGCVSSCTRVRDNKRVVMCTRLCRKGAGVKSIRVTVYHTRVDMQSVVSSGGITAVACSSLCREDREPLPRQRNVFRHHSLLGEEDGEKVEDGSFNVSDRAQVQYFCEIPWSRIRGVGNHHITRATVWGVCRSTGY
jgi:hypothetical protein